MSARNETILVALRSKPVLTLGITALLAVASCYGQSSGPTSPGEVASTSVSRGALAPDFLHAFGFGYYTYINGVNGPMFNGLPSEATAFFTFKTSVASTLPLAQNIDMSPALSSGATYDIYYDPNPNHTWTDSNSFTTGTKVATFQRTGFILSGIGFAAFETFNSSLTFSQPFTFNGQTNDFKNLTPGLRTSNMFGRFPFPSGIPDFPVFLSFSGNAVATVLPAPSAVTTAVAGPQGATVGAREFQLDGTKSISADGKPLIYQWSLVPGYPSAGILHGDTATPDVQFYTRGVYRFQLTVTDSAGHTASDSVSVNFVGP
jgi:PKD domain